MIRPFMPAWLKSERVEFVLECVGTFLLPKHRSSTGMGSPCTTS